MSQDDRRGKPPGGPAWPVPQAGQPPPYAPPPSPYAPPPYGQPQPPQAPYAQPPQAPYAQPPQAPYVQPPSPSQQQPYGQPPHPLQPPPSSSPYGQPPYPPQQQPSQKPPSPQPSPYGPSPHGQSPYSQQPHSPPPGYAPPPPYPQGTPHAPPAAQHAAGPVPLPRATVHRHTHLVATVQAPRGHGFGAMAALSFKRAFRLRIEPNEILEDERHAMAIARPPISDETQQAFLAWRRSVLFMAALLMVPVAFLHAYENLQNLENLPEGWKTLTYASVAIEAGFAIFLWTQVRRWTAWKRQARALSWVWLIYFLTPFLVFLYPLASALDLGEATGEQRRQMQLGIGVLIGAQALISLVPKVISLLQGLIRASIATKSLFPGASAPGWLMVIAAPLYMIIFYIFVLLPYHFSGSGLVVVGMLLVLAAKGSLVGAGLRLTKPMPADTARHATQRTLRLWMALLITGAACIVGGLWGLVSQASPLTLVNFALSMGANILLLTLIATDALITALDRARGTTADERGLADEPAAQVAAFTAVGTHDRS